MATYREIKGLNVPYLDADPPSASATSQAGEVWYNSSVGELRTFVFKDSWATSAPLSTAKEAGAGAGTSPAGIVFGGYDTANSVVTEEYNGSGWAPGGDMNTARRRLGGCGTQTAALAFGGYVSGPVTAGEEYNGASWSETNDLNQARHSIAAAGTQTAGLASMGGGPGATDWTNVEEYNGTSWTAVTAAPTATQKLGGAGTQTAQIAMSGTTTNSNYVTESYEYDGSSWTDGGDVNTGRMELAAAGTQSDAICFGGDTGSVSALTEAYDGTSWTETTDLSTAREMPAGLGTAAAGVGAGGYVTAVSAATEEFSRSVLTYTPATWATGGTLNTARAYMGSAGDKSAGLGFGGYGPGNTFETSSETYNGFAWSEGNNLNTGRDRAPGLGTSTAALTVGGRTPSTTTKAEEYNGASWTEVTAIPGYSGTQTLNMAGSGTQVAGLIAGGGGTIPGNTTKSSEYDGSSWTEGGALNTARGGAVGAGTQAGSLCIGGNYAPAPVSNPGPFGVTAIVEDYNGASWSEVGDLPVSTGAAGAAGNPTGAIVFGGETGPTPSGVATTWQYDGTAWATASAIPQGVTNKCGGTGATVGVGLAMGGYNGPGAANRNESSEYSDTTTAATSSNIDFD